MKYRWRGNGSAFSIVKNMEDISHYLKFLYHEERRISPLLDNYYETYNQSDNEDESLSEFCKITQNASAAECGMRFTIDTTILLMAIDLENMVNHLAYLTLNKNTLEAIETLSITNKLEVIHQILEIEPLKGNKEYQDIKKMVSYRNAYAHGKNTDMSTKSLIKNHVEQPEEYQVDADHKIAELVSYGYSYINSTYYIDSINPKIEEQQIGHSCHYWIHEYLEAFEEIDFDGNAPITLIREVNDDWKMSVYNFRSE